MIQLEKIEIGEWLINLLNDGAIKDREDFLITVDGKEIVIFEPICDSDGDIEFKVKKSRC